MMPMTVVEPTNIVTERQLELLALYASGYGLQEIADLKFLAYPTVKNIFATARERTGAKSLTHLCVMLVDGGKIARNGDGGYHPVQDERGI